MTKETRLNLIFLAAFLAVSLPGAVMLVKKMRPGAAPAPLSRPDPVRRRLVYVAPQGASDAVERYVPPVTRDWLCAIDRERGGSGDFLLRGREGVVSADRSLQVLNVTTTAGGTELSLVIWEPADVVKLQVSADGVMGKVERSDSVVVPAGVRGELQDGGFVTPPKMISWLRVRFEAPFTKGRRVQVQVRSGDAEDGVAKSVNLFTS